MRTIFHDPRDESFFRKNGFVIFDLLKKTAIGELWSFYSASFAQKHEVSPFARNLPYYISIFDEDSEHKKQVDQLISDHVAGASATVMVDFEVFYSNFMIKFPGDGQIEAHQDFNFVAEAEHTAFNLWCPLVDTTRQNGGLFVIPGSHRLFKTQRGPNIPKALTRYNDLLQRYSSFVPLRKGQAIVFDHKLVHFSPPNRTSEVRVAIQSVLKPREAQALHFFFDQPSSKVIAYEIDRRYILENDLWRGTPNGLSRHHEEELIPFPEEGSIMDALVRLKLEQTRDGQAVVRPMFREPALQEQFDRDGYVKLPLLQAEEVAHLRRLFVDLIGEDVSNSDYGMYISLEERDAQRKALLIDTLSELIAPVAQRHFADCKPHLGSYLVKAPGMNSFTYPHQDWTFVSTPGSTSLTLWIALVDTDDTNGALGFVKGSHRFFERPIGSPSPDFRTYTQGHEDIFYEYLELVPLRAGEAVAFDNRTIHGAPPNRTAHNRIAVAIGMTPAEAPLYHYYLLPGESSDNRQIGRLAVDQGFFRRYSVRSLKELFDSGSVPEGYKIEEVIEDGFQPFSREEIRSLCECAGLQKSGRQLVRTGTPARQSSSRHVELARRVTNRLRGMFAAAKQ